MSIKDYGLKDHLFIEKWSGYLDQFMINHVIELDNIVEIKTDPFNPHLRKYEVLQRIGKLLDQDAFNQAQKCAVHPQRMLNRVGLPQVFDLYRTIGLIFLNAIELGRPPAELLPSSAEFESRFPLGYPTENSFRNVDQDSAPYLVKHLPTYTLSDHLCPNIGFDALISKYFEFLEKSYIGAQNRVFWNSEVPLFHGVPLLTCSSSPQNSPLSYLSFGQEGGHEENQDARLKCQNYIASKLFDRRPA